MTYDPIHNASQSFHTAIWALRAQDIAEGRSKPVCEQERVFIGLSKEEAWKRSTKVECPHV